MSKINSHRRDDLIYDRSDIWLLIPSILTALLAFALFIPLKLGANVPVFIFAVYTVVFTYQGKSKSESDRGSIYLLLVALIALLPFILYDTSPFRILAFILLNFFVLFQIFTMYGCRYYKRIFSENWMYDAFNAVVLMPFANFGVFWRILSSRSVLFRLAAFFCAFAAAPVIAISFSGVYKYGFLPCLGTYILSSVIFTAIVCYSYGFLYGCRRAVNTCILKKPAPESLRRLPKWVSITVLSALCLFCTLYIVDQILFFLPIDEIRLSSESLSEYARQGFLELCEMVLVNLAAIACTAVFTRIPKNRPAGRSPCPWVLFLIILLSFLSIILIAAAFVKMLLYMKAYGLTTNRLITSFFMFGLLIVCVIIIARSFDPRVRMIRSISIAAVTMFLLLCFADCDYLALSYNRSAYISGRLPGFDINMLYSSGDSIVPVMIDVYENSTGQVKSDAIRFLNHYGATYDDTFGKARSFNISSYNAHNRYIQWKNK